MQRITHIYFALFLFAIVWVIFDIGLETSIFVAFGAIFPDFDIVKLHRRLLHNIWALLAVSIAISLFFIKPDPLIGISWGLAFLLGGLSHLLMDSLTKWGIQPMWPLYKDKWLHLFKDKDKWLTTGGKTERVIAMIILFFGLFLFYLKMLNFDLPITIFVTLITVAVLFEGEKYLPKVYRED